MNIVVGKVVIAQSLQWLGCSVYRLEIGARFLTRTGDIFSVKASKLVQMSTQDPVT